MMTARQHCERNVTGGSIAGRGAVVLASLCICGLAGSTEAQEYCVSCAEPAAVYRCVIDGAQPGGSQPLQVLCITAMAKEGAHGSCSLKRGTVFDCNGPVKRVSWAAYNPGVPAAATPAPRPGKDGAPKQDAAAPPGEASDPPQTVEDMAKRAGGQAADQAKSVGQKMGEASKKTWNCIVSLFTRCGE